jgi:hypothetical protein
VCLQVKAAEMAAEIVELQAQLQAAQAASAESGQQKAAAQVLLY